MNIVNIKKINLLLFFIGFYIFDNTHTAITLADLKTTEEAKNYKGPILKPEDLEKLELFVPKPAKPNSYEEQLLKLARTGPPADILGKIKKSDKINYYQDIKNLLTPGRIYSEADINAIDIAPTGWFSGSQKAGNTALHYAAMRGDLELYKLLLEQGARDSIENSDGKTAREVAIEEIADFLKTTKPAEASYLGKITPAFIGKNIPTTVLSSYEDQLFDAAKMGNMPKIIELTNPGTIYKGANINAQNSLDHNRTVLHYAAIFATNTGKRDFYNNLLQQFPLIDSSAKDDYGRTPLWYLANRPKTIV